MFEPSFGPCHVGQHREQPLWAQYQEPDQEHEQDFGAKPTTHSLIGTCSLARLWGCTSQRLRNRVARFVMPESEVSLCDHQLKPKRPGSSSSLVGASDTALRLAVTNLSPTVGKKVGSFDSAGTSLREVPAPLRMTIWNSSCTRRLATP